LIFRALLQVSNFKNRIMQIRNKFNSILPHFIAVLLFTLISFAYFYPVLEGKIMKANDTTVSRVNAKEIQDYRAKEKKEPLWTNSIFSGMPAYMISALYPGNLLKHVDTFLRSYGMPVSVLFLTLLGFYILLLIFGFNPWLAITGAIAYSLSAYLFQILGAGHITKAVALAYMAPMIGAVYYSYRYDAIKGGLFTAFILALEIQANHPQITYYAFICILIFVIFEFVYSLRSKLFLKFIRTSLLLILAFLLAIGINFASLYTFYEYGKYSTRGKSDLVTDNANKTKGLDKNYITYWSYGVDETMNLLIPNFKGGSSHPFSRTSETYKACVQNKHPDAANQIQQYWGKQPGTEGPNYLGAIVIFLFVLGLMVIKGREKWWLLTATVLSVMLAWGKNFMPLTDLFIEFFPGYNKFRAVTMILVIAQFCVPLLGFLALRDIFNGTVSKKELIKSLKIATAVTGGIVLLFLVIPGIAGSFLGEYEAYLPDWIKAPVIADRKAMLRSDALRSLVFILLSSGVITGFALEKLKKNQAIIILAILIVSDMWIVDKRYLNADRFERNSVIQKLFTPSAADNYILKDHSVFRVLNLYASTFNDNTPTSYFHKSIGGYHGAKLKRYQELIDTSLIYNINLIETLGRSAKTVEDFQTVFNSTHVLNMLNTRYIIYNAEMPPIVNQNALGNAWFVEKPVMVENANRELSSLNTLNTSKEAVIDNIFREQITKSSYPVLENEKIELVTYKPDELDYKYTAKEEKLVIFSEIYYPAGWISYLDGKECKYFRADYVLRGMVVPPGDHEIKFLFRPASYIAGNKISLASSLILFLLTAVYIGLQFRSGKKAQ
jgi:hypothetical protein